MKTPSLPFALRGLLLCGLTLVGAGISPADILVSNFGTGKISRHRNDGSLVKSSFISGLAGPTALHVNGSHLYVANTNGGTVSRYNLDGTASKVPFISGLLGPIGLASETNNLYIAKFGAGEVGRYNLTTGATLNSSFISVFTSVQGILCSGGKLTVTFPESAVVRQYDLSTTSEEEALSDGIENPTAIITDAKGRLYISDSSTKKIGLYEKGLGEIDAGFITSGLNNTTGMAFVGKNLAVVNNTTGIVSLFSSSGKLVKKTFIDAGEGAFGIVVLKENTPYPTPSLSYKGSKSITTSKSTITLKGTSKNAKVVEVKLGTAKAVKLPKATPWTYTGKLKEGKNTIVITSRGEGGTSKALKITVTRKSKKASALLGGE